MTSALRAFFDKTPPPLELESYRVEHQLEPYWHGRPAKGPYAIQMAAAILCGLLGAILFLIQTTPSLAVLVAGALVACLYPFVAARDWHQTEYMLLPDAIIHKAGAFSRALRVHPLDRFTDIEEETPRFAHRLGYRNLHLRTYEEDAKGQLVEVAEDVKLANVPASVAAGFLDVLDLLAEPSTEASESVMSQPSGPEKSESPPGDQP